MQDWIAVNTTETLMVDHFRHDSLLAKSCWLLAKNPFSYSLVWGLFLLILCFPFFCSSLSVFFSTSIFRYFMYNLYHISGKGINRFSVDLTIEWVVWSSLRVISAKWLALHRFLPSEFDDVIIFVFQFISMYGAFLLRHFLFLLLYYYYHWLFSIYHLFVYSFIFG